MCSLRVSLRYLGVVPISTRHHGWVPEDPPDEAPWAMQLVARIEKSSPPDATAMLECAAMSVVALLAHPRSGVDGDWHGEVERWLAGRIRKLARRARGVEWRRVQELPGVTVRHHGAEVRAFVPGPTDAVAPDLYKLQLQGFDLDDPHRATGPLAPDLREVVIARSPHVEISLGKAAAQVGHASNFAWLGMAPERRREWAVSGFPLRVVHPPPAAFDAVEAAAAVRVVDAGFTELDGPALTCVASWRD